MNLRQPLRQAPRQAREGPQGRLLQSPPSRVQLVGKWFAAWVVFSPLIFLPAFGCCVKSFPSTTVVQTSSASPFTLAQPATSTAVVPPTATATLPPPTDTPPSAAPPEPTDMVSLPTTTDLLSPTVALNDEATPTTATQPASAPASPTAAPTDTPTLTPTLQAVTTATAIVEGSPKRSTTYTARVDVPRGSLLDRLTRNKPGIWGHKAFYVGLVAVYIILLVLFFRLLFQLARQSD